MEDNIEYRIGRDWKYFTPVYGIFNYAKREEIFERDTGRKIKLTWNEEGYLAAAIWAQYAYVPIGMVAGAAIKSLIDLI